MQHLLCKAVNVVTALGAIHLGLAAVGFNLLDKVGVANLAAPLGYLFGICGVISLIMIFTCRKCEG